MSVSYKINGAQLSKIFDLYSYRVKGVYVARVKLKNTNDNIILVGSDMMSNELLKTGNWDIARWPLYYVGAIQFESEEDAFYYTLKYDLTFL